MTGVLIRPARVDDAQGMIDVLNPIIRAGGTTAIESEYTLDAQRAYLGGIGPGAACHVAEDAAIEASHWVESQLILYRAAGDAR